MFVNIFRLDVLIHYMMVDAVLITKTISHIYIKSGLLRLLKLKGQTFHFLSSLPTISLSPDRSLFLLAVGVANDAAPRITGLFVILLCLGLGLNVSLT